MKPLDSYKCTIKSDFCNVCVEVDKIVRFLNTSMGDLDECNLFEVKVILNELLLNAIKHGNKQDCSKNVNIDASIVEGSKLYFSIEDEGEGFNYNEKVNNCEDFIDLKETGRGILIVKNLCDELEFNDRGNKVTVLKSLCKY